MAPKLLQWNPALARAVGERITKARNDKGWSLAHVAERLDVNKATVGHWETGVRTIKIGDLVRLCVVLGVSADKILYNVERWPFQKLDYEKVAKLDAEDIARIEGGIALVAAQLEIDIEKRQRAAA